MTFLHAQHGYCVHGVIYNFALRTTWLYNIIPSSTYDCVSGAILVDSLSEELDFLTGSAILSHLAHFWRIPMFTRLSQLTISSSLIFPNDMSLNSIKTSTGLPEKKETKLKKKGTKRKRTSNEKEKNVDDHDKKKCFPTSIIRTNIFVVGF